MQLLIYGKTDPFTNSMLKSEAFGDIIERLTSGSSLDLSTVDQGLLTDLVEHDILKKSAADYDFGPRMVYIDTACYNDLVSSSESTVRKYVQFVTEKAEELKHITEWNLPGVVERFGWNYLSDVIIGALLMDLATGSQLYSSCSFPQRAWLICYSSIVSSTPEIGVRLISNSSNSAVVGLFWNDRHGNSDIGFCGEDVELLQSIRNGLTDDRVVSVQSRLLALQYRKVLKRTDYSYEINCPIFSVSRFEPLREALSRISETIVNEIIFPGFRRLRPEIPSVLAGQDDRLPRLIYNRLLMVAAYSKLALSGVVGAPNVSDDTCWGTWMWVKDAAESFPFLDDIGEFNG